MAFHSRFHQPKLPGRPGIHEVTRICSQFKIENVCKPGSTLLWDLLQDDKIVSICVGDLVEADVMVIDGKEFRFKVACRLVLTLNQDRSTSCTHYNARQRY
jgi:hypothetical protein